MSSKNVTLAVETSSRIGSIALADGGDLLGETTFSGALRHSAELFPSITELLQRFGYTAGEIGQVAISIGPGSFTGLRIAVTAAKCIHLANKARIVTVDSLDATAAHVTDAGPESIIQNSEKDDGPPRRLATILDAKRGQFYAAVYEYVAAGASPEAQEAEQPGYDIPAYEQGCWRKILPDCLITAADLLDRFADKANPIAVMGDGLLYHQDKFTAEGTRIVHPDLWGAKAAQIHVLGHQKAQVGRFSDPTALTPFYLRGPQVTLRKRA